MKEKTVSKKKVKTVSKMKVKTVSKKLIRLLLNINPDLASGDLSRYGIRRLDTGKRPKPKQLTRGVKARNA